MAAARELLRRWRIRRVMIKRRGFYKRVSRLHLSRKGSLWRFRERVTLR